MFVVQGYYAGKTYFKTIWSFFDIMYVVVNGLVGLALIIDGMIDIKALRMIEATLSIVIIVKLIYFTQLMDEIAPLVNIILMIFNDIGWFMIIFLITAFSFALSFNLIGQNQYKEVIEEAQLNL